ncbi:kinase-like domain-containing protein [Rhizophagus irregularis DAOM 181602=DAOM 197198]|nr:kinase-like domain-containing protein [Rhizophagus irregularis DAOM 181602=DAOM 197198]
MLILGILPGPNEVKLHRVNHYLSPIIMELESLWEGVILNRTYECPNGKDIRAALIIASCDIPGARKLCGHISALASCHRCEKGPIIAILVQRLIINYLLGSLPNSHHQIEPELMRQLMTEAQINDIINSSSSEVIGLELLDKRPSVSSLSEFPTDEMYRFLMNSRNISESPITGCEEFPGKFLAPQSKDIHLEEQIFDLLIEYYEDTYVDSIFRKPIDDDVETCNIELWKDSFYPSSRDNIILIHNILEEVSYEEEEEEEEEEEKEEEVIDKSRDIEIEYSLIDVELIPTFKSLDIRVTNIPEFPSEEFGNFMELLTKWNLSDACGIVEQMSNKDIFAHCTFKFTLLNHNGERIYNEQYNGQWWERVQKSFPNGANVLSVILYSDAMTRDHLGKTSEHPIYLTLGNIVSWRRNRPDAKILLGYLLILKAKDISQKRSKSFQLAKQVLYQYALNILTRIRAPNRCLDANPLNRPNAIEIKKTLSQWFRESFESQDDSRYSALSTNLGISYETHSEAIYTSRLLNFCSLPELENSGDYYKVEDNIISMKSLGSLQIDNNNFPEPNNSYVSYEKNDDMTSMNSSGIR